MANHCDDRDPDSIEELPLDIAYDDDQRRTDRDVPALVDVCD